MSVDKLVDSTQLDADLTSVANAIRTKGGTSASLAFPADFVSAIAAIPSGGSGDKAAIAEVTPATNGYVISVSCDFEPTHVFVINYSPWDNYEANENTFKWPTNSNIAIYNFYPEWTQRAGATSQTAASITNRTRAESPALSYSGGILTINGTSSNMNWIQFKADNRYVVVMVQHTEVS